MSFHRRDFSDRFGEMGDTAEAVFDTVHPRSHKLGLNRPPFYLGGMPASMRYLPDRMTRHAFVEVMGIGRDGTLKLKDEKLAALREWSTLGPVELFVYDKSKHEYYEGPLADWVGQIETKATRGTFKEGKGFHALHRDDFPADPTPLANAT